VPELNNNESEPEIESSPTGILSENPDKIFTCINVDINNLSPLNSFFDQVFIINLPNRIDRREEMVKKLTRLNIRAEFFPAENGYSKSNLIEFKKYFTSPINVEEAHEMEIKLKRKVITSPGAWGILKTYHNLISVAKNRNYKKILCLEDDVIFARDFDEMFNNSSRLIPDNWKLIYLGASQHSWEENVDLVTPKNVFSGHEPLRYYFPLNTDGAFAIGIRNTIFDQLLAYTALMNCPMDTGALRNISRQNIGTCFVIQPNLIIADVRQSDIRSRRNQREFAQIAKWDLNIYDLNDF